MSTEQEPMRASRFINFETGKVELAPRQLERAQSDEEWTIKQKIDYFQCRVEVWQIAPAVEMLKMIEATKATKNEPTPAWCHSAYGLVFILASYFEMVGKILRLGSSQWKGGDKDFIEGFRHIYPNSPFLNSHLADENADPRDPMGQIGEICDLMRNGLFHLGFTKKNFFIHNQPEKFENDFEYHLEPIDEKHAAELYYLNPHALTRTIVDHFGRFIEELRKDTALHANFVKFIDDFHKPRR